MEAVTLTRKQWKFITQPILKATLPKAGIVRTFPRTIVHGPTGYTGLNLQDPFETQFIRQLKGLLDHTSRESMMHITLEPKPNNRLD